jgi:signal peptidase I
METSRELGPSPLLEAPSSLHAEVLNLSKDLDIDLWFRGKVDRPQSVLIRSTTPDGITKSAFMHINGTVEQIPVFDNQDPLVLQEKKQSRVRDFTWTPNKPKRTGTVRFVAKVTSALLALIFLATLITGIAQMRVVLTGSMIPAINPGDLVVALSKDYVTPHVGKVVLYSARDLQGNAVTVWSHRIVAGSARIGFTIKGDANPQPDIGVIPLSDIQSVVVLRIPFIGHLFNIYSLILIFSGLTLLSIVSSQRKIK